ncbi:MAG TPA: sialidase family protein [Thermoleophilaceae bacterium]
MRRTSQLAAVCAAFVVAASGGAARAATPAEGTLAPNAEGAGKLAWSGSVGAGTASGGGTTDDCFTTAGAPDPSSGCDFFKLNVNVPDGFYEGFLGGVQIDVSGFAPFDLDLGVYRRKPDGSRGDFVIGSGNVPGEAERTTIPKASGAYLVVLVPYAAPPGQAYQGVASFGVKKADPPLDVLNRRLGEGPPNYRASHDQYNSHSEPSIAMDPLDGEHLIAGSKMYENLEHYLFKAGTYESFDGGRTWKDYGQLPGYCKEAGQCDPSDEARYRTVSDISMAFDDEGNAYANVLDAPGGTFAFTGFNMTVHVKPPGKAWSDPIIVHDNRNNPISEQLLLDDKNWIAVDNVTDVNGGQNKPKDGKVGTIYVCWSFDGTQAPTQQIVVMRSIDGGKTWGGLVPGDNTPYQLSAKQAISGIGCHVVIGPSGEVYATWYDNQLDALMQAKSTSRGAAWTPARPVALITGVNEQFEGQSFRNLSIPTTGIDAQGNVYLAVASRDADGEAVLEGTFEQAVEQAKRFREERRPETEAEGEGDKPGSGSDVVMFKSTDGGASYTGPVRVNQDAATADADQFQPWMAVTPKGQVNVMYFDRRNDPNNFFIGEILSRSNDGGKTFKDVRVDNQMWDPRINPPVSVSGEFIGDYQGLVADDSVAIPFWNDTQAANLSKSSSAYSPWQEVWAARISNTPSLGGPCRDRTAPTTKLGRKGVSAGRRGLSLRGTVSDRKTCNAGVKAVYVSVARIESRHGCRFMDRNGRFGKRRSCHKATLLTARGTRRWTFRSKRRLARGQYRIVARARDRSGNKEKPRSGRNVVVLKVR